MSAHGCNELCDLDERFHEIQKYEGEFEAWSAYTEEIREILLKKIEGYYYLLIKLK